MFSALNFTRVMKPIRDTNSESGLPVKQMAINCSISVCSKQYNRVKILYQNAQGLSISLYIHDQHDTTWKVLCTLVTHSFIISLVRDF